MPQANLLAQFLNKVKLTGVAELAVHRRKGSVDVGVGVGVGAVAVAASVATLMLHKHLLETWKAKVVFSHQCHLTF